jgi:Tfp pilus assembly protein PilN
MRAVNLLPRDEVPKSFEAKRGVVFGAAGGAALVTVLLVAGMISAGGAASEQQARIDSLNAELAALPKPPAGADSGITEETLTADKSARIAALSTALSGRVAWDRVLRQISQVIPGDVWLASLGSVAAEVSQTGTPAVGAAAPGVVLSGSTYSQDGVARVLARLSVTPALTNVRLQSSTVQPIGARRIVQFTIMADIRTAGSAQ